MLGARQCFFQSFRFLTSVRQKARIVDIEREVLPPPRDQDTLRTWAKQLGLKQDSDDWLKFFDYAAVDAGRIPDYVLKDEELVELVAGMGNPSPPRHGRRRNRNMEKARDSILPDVPITLISGGAMHDVLSRNLIPQWIEEHAKWLSHYPHECPAYQSPETAAMVRSLPNRN